MAQEAEQVTYQSTGWWFDCRLLQWQDTTYVLGFLFGFVLFYTHYGLETAGQPSGKKMYRKFLFLDQLQVAVTVSETGLNISQ